MMIRSIALSLSLLVALALGACVYRYESFVSAGVEPRQTLNRSDPIYVTLPTQPNIRERQLFPSLTAELCRNGFTVVDTLEQATWVMALSFESETREFGTTTTAVIIPGQFISSGIATTRANTRTDSIARLYLVRKSDFVTGNARPVWEGTVGTEQQVFRVYQPMIFDNLLDKFGQNFEGPVKMSKLYLRDARLPCPAGSPPE